MRNACLGALVVSTAGLGAVVVYLWRTRRRALVRADALALQSSVGRGQLSRVRCLAKVAHHMNCHLDPSYLTRELWGYDLPDREGEEE